MVLISITLFSIWLIPLFKVFEKIAIWHILLVVTLFFAFINRNRFYVLLRIVKQNSEFLILALLFPFFIFIRDGFGSNLSSVLNDYILRGIAGFLFAICIATYFNPNNKKRLLFLLLGVILIFNATVGILQIINPNVFFQLPDKITHQIDFEQRSYDGRIRGLFIHVHIFSQHMLGLTSLFIPSIFFTTKKTKFMPKPLFNIVVILLGITSILFTFTRSSYLGIIISFIIVVYFSIKFRLLRNKKNLRKLFLICGLLLIFIFIIAKGLNISEQSALPRLLYFGGRTDIMRTETFKLAIAEFQNYPIFGIGGRAEVGEIAIHNIFLKVLTYYGLIGLSIYLFFYLFLFLKIKSMPKEFQVYKIGLFIWLATYLLYGLVHTSGFWIGGLFEWTFVGLILSFTQWTNKSKASNNYYIQSKTYIEKSA